MRYTIVEYVHNVVRNFKKENGFYIDATVGNGYDTEFLLAGQPAKLIGFDVQEAAIEQTRKRLLDAGISSGWELKLDGHENMDKYAQEGSVDIIMFNFGYLPGTSHEFATKLDTSIQAIEKGLKLLKKGGIMSLCIYSGGDTGFEEKDGILNYVKGIDSKEYVVIRSEFCNRKNNPPVPVFVVRE